MAALKEHAKTNFSLANWKGRLFRFVGVTIGYWMGLGLFDADTTWDLFGDIAAKPMQAGGLVMVWIAALSTTGKPKSSG